MSSFKTSITYRAIVLALALACSAACVQAQNAVAAVTATQPAKEDPSTPAIKAGNAKFIERHAAFLKRAKEGPIGLLFLGDSITEGWNKAPELWQEYYGKYQPANFGIGGDRTQHVLWRIENGELDGIRPRVVVFMLGTNNSADATGEQIAAADRKIIQQIRTKIPGAQILLLAIFPRGPRKNSIGTWDDAVRRSEVIRAANLELAKLDDGKMIRYLDIGPKFLGPDGKIPNEIMPDQLHPNAAGYKIWAAAMQPLLEEMLRK